MGDRRPGGYHASATGGTLIAARAVGRPSIALVTIPSDRRHPMMKPQVNHTKLAAIKVKAGKLTGTHNTTLLKA